MASLAMSRGTAEVLAGILSGGLLGAAGWGLQGGGAAARTARGHQPEGRADQNLEALRLP